MSAWIRTFRAACFVSLCVAGSCKGLREDGKAAALAPKLYASECSGGVMQIVAHADDDLLFMNPDILGDVESGKCVRTVFVTAGDAGEGPEYWRGREDGARAAYATMARVADSWRTAEESIDGHEITIQTLEERPTVSLVFLRLPDGCTGGDGCGGRYGGDSLQRLWHGERSIRAVDGSSRYSADGLVNVLANLIDGFDPYELRVQDHVGYLGDGDHPDHHVAAYFAARANESLGHSRPLAAYLGYRIGERPENVSGRELRAKQRAFFAYAAHDSRVCGSVEACGDGEYGRWLRRQYRVDGHYHRVEPRLAPMPISHIQH